MVTYWYIATHALRKLFRRIYHGFHVVYVSDGDKCDRCYGEIKYIPEFKDGRIMLETRLGTGHLRCMRCGYDNPYIQIGNERPEAEAMINITMMPDGRALVKEIWKGEEK